MGTLLEHQTSQSEEAHSRLLRDLDEFLKRDRDRELFDLPPLAEATPVTAAPAPAASPSRPAERLPALRGWAPARLPDGSWGTRHSALGKLPTDLEGATVEIKTRSGEILIRTVVEVVERTADYVLVRDSGKP